MAKETDEFFERILGFLDPESLFECLRLQGESHGRAQTNLPETSETPGIHDTEVLRSLLPGELYDSVRSERLLGYHALSFSLRHRVCQLNALFHLQSLPEHLRTPFAKVFEGYFPQDSSPLEGGFSDSLPVFGFSPVGVHTTLRTRGACRAFDAYDLRHCSQEAEPLLCRQHAQEAWWERKGGTAQATMYAYYARRENFHDLDEEALQRLMGRFYEKLNVWRDADILPALQRFELDGPEEFFRLGPRGLKERYFALARKAHPDQGGTGEGFRALKEAYDLLRMRL